MFNFQLSLNALHAKRKREREKKEALLKVMK
jgi:hypothetical protein